MVAIAWWCVGAQGAEGGEALEADGASPGEGRSGGGRHALSRQRAPVRYPAPLQSRAHVVTL